MSRELVATLEAVARFYDARAVGHLGPEGYRRTTPLADLLAGLPRLIELGVLESGVSTWLDSGCGDGRVSRLVSYLVRASIGIELEDWILSEQAELAAELQGVLAQGGHLALPENVSFLCGDALAGETHAEMAKETGLAVGEIDVFYTFLCLHQEIAGLMVERARDGAHLVVYGLDLIVPELPGLVRVEAEDLLARRLVVYRKG